MKKLPRRVVILTNNGTDALEEIIEDLKTIGRSTLCPDWKWITSLYFSSCFICKQLFPKKITCPCLTYSPNYLIKRLREILRYNESEPR